MFLLALPWVATAIVAIIVGKSIYDRVHSEGGKVVAIVGPRRAGKTTLTRYMAEGVKLPLEYSPTQLHGEYEIKINGSAWILSLRDFGGGDDQVREWAKSEAARHSDEVWFIASAAQLHDDDQRAKAYTRARAVTAAQLKANAVLVVTHSDLDEGFDGSRPESLSVSDEVKQLARILGSVRTVVGSLHSSDLADELVAQLVGEEAP